jgi:hypothetical protein
MEELWIKSVKMEQKGRNWNERQYFNIGSIEFFSSSGRFSSGVFRTLFDSYRETIRKFVCVTARDFDPRDIHSIRPRTLVHTWSGLREWIEIDFLERQLLLSGYRLERGDRLRLRSWSFLGSNDRGLPLDEWTVIESRNESRRDEYELLQGFDCVGGPFRYFRLVNEGLRWDNKTALIFWHLELFGCLFPVDP